MHRSDTFQHQWGPTHFAKSHTFAPRTCANTLKLSDFPQKSHFRKSQTCSKPPHRLQRGLQRRSAQSVAAHFAQHLRHLPVIPDRARRAVYHALKLRRVGNALTKLLRQQRPTPDWKQPPNPVQNERDTSAIGRHHWWICGSGESFRTAFARPPTKSGSLGRIR